MTRCLYSALPAVNARKALISGLVIFMLTGWTPAMAEPFPHLSDPAKMSLLPSLEEGFSKYEVILKPDKLEKEWWAGAPSVVRDSSGVFWMACRMRTPESPIGLRGYEVRILKSLDGEHFEKVHSILREQVPIPGFERPSLLIDPANGMFKLYGCGPWQDGPWSIIKWNDAKSPTEFVASTAHPVIQKRSLTYPRDVPVSEYKDPFIFYAEGAYHCYVIGVVRRAERVFHFSSVDGESWEPVGNPYTSIMSQDGWHNFYVRPACLLRMGPGWLFVYEGSNVEWYDPVYNIATGLGFTFDLHTVIDLTPDAPFMTSSTPNPLFQTFRYSHWMEVGDEIWVYAEVACPDETHEIRLFKIRRR